LKSVFTGIIISCIQNGGTIALRKGEAQKQARQDMADIRDPQTYLDHIIAKYAAYFDITKEFSAAGRTFPAYGFFAEQDEKYVLSRKANLWTAKRTEHILFTIEDTCTPETVEKARSVIEDFMEPELVRHGKKYPEKDHMSSILNFAVLARRGVTADAVRAIRKFSFDRGYMFSIRGFSRGRLIVVDLAGGKVYTDKAAGAVRKSFEKTFEDLEHGRKGFNELYGATPEPVGIR